MNSLGLHVYMVASVGELVTSQCFTQKQQEKVTMTSIKQQRTHSDVVVVLCIEYHCSEQPVTVYFFLAWLVSPVIHLFLLIFVDLLFFWKSHEALTLLTFFI